MVNIDLHYVDELIKVRQDQHGGERGAPIIENGHRVGASINRSCIVMLSAILQSFVEEVYCETAFELLSIDGEKEKAAFRKSFAYSGNPSAKNITQLFRRLGIVNIFDGLSWQGLKKNEQISTNLDKLNTLRNKIAHGHEEIVLDKKPYSLTLAKVSDMRNFVHTFADRFPHHVRKVTKLGK